MGEELLDDQWLLIKPALLAQKRRRRLGQTTGVRFKRHPPKSSSG
jgi:hypothetical protein